jgi:hypothetical protein
LACTTLAELHRIPGLYTDRQPGIEDRYRFIFSLTDALAFDQRLDGRPIRDPARICVVNWIVYPGLGALRRIDQHSFDSGLPRFAGVRRLDDGLGGPVSPSMALRIN